MFSFVAGLLFGAVGLAAFVYGKKNTLWKPMIIGGLLLIFPYFVESLLGTLLVGGVLVALLFFPG